MAKARCYMLNINVISDSIEIIIFQKETFASLICSDIYSSF